MTLNPLHNQLIRELIGKGLPHDKARTIVEIAEHGRHSAFETMMRIADSAPDTMNIEVLLVMLALMDVHLTGVKKECEKFVLAVAEGKI